MVLNKNRIKAIKSVKTLQNLCNNLNEVLEKQYSAKQIYLSNIKEIGFFFADFINVLSDNKLKKKGYSDFLLADKESNVYLLQLRKTTNQRDISLLKDLEKKALEKAEKEEE